MYRYQRLLEKVAGRALIVGVSKFADLSQMMELYHQGLRHFAESRIQQALTKMDEMPKDIAWHLTGHLQSNKINKALNRFTLIQSVHNLELLKALSERTAHQEVLLQVNTSGEATKQGLTPEEWEPLLPQAFALPNLRIRGLMTIGPLEEDPRTSFATLRTCLERWKPNPHFDQLSMGMTNDWEIALDEGATILRIGRGLFSA